MVAGRAGYHAERIPESSQLLEEVNTRPAARLWFQYLPAETLPLVPKLVEQVLLGELTRRQAAAELDRIAKDAVR